MSGKLVLAVIDGCKPSMLRRAIDTGRAPALKAIEERGTNAEAATAAFPSVTPVCAAAIATGTLQDVHHIPSMNWYSRKEGRYVEYGSSFAASWRFGLGRQLTDTVYNMNAEHLNPEALTVFEALDDQDIRTAGTTYLMYRGRHEHQPSKEFALSRLASTMFRRTVRGPRELFYADLYASRVTGCFGQMGLPGVRDQHTGCVSAYLAEHDLFDFLLFSLPDNDAYSHKHGPHAQVESIAAADRQLERLFHAMGGTEAFLDQHAVVVVADHSHAPVEATIDLQSAIAQDWAVLRPSGARAADAEVAFCPAQRSAMLYVLQAEARERAIGPLAATALETDGVDLAMWLDADGYAIVAGPGGRLRFRPGDDVADARGHRWELHGEPGALQAEVGGHTIATPVYPDALRRVWGALTCPTSGDLLLSAAPSWEFPDWGGQAHVGGGSHGSLHRVDSEGALVFSGLARSGVLTAREADGAWSITDVAPMSVAHFGAR